MAKSQYEYVKQFERFDQLLPNVWTVVRVDGRGFHKFSKVHEFEKPNDNKALQLMNAAAVAVMEDFSDIVLAYGDSDEFSFVFRRSYSAYERRESKLITTIASLFSANYVYRWSKYFPEKTLIYPPSFDARAVLYPSDQNLRDYLSWRQADCHINNLYNTTFWALVQRDNFVGKPLYTAREAEARLKGTLAKNKNEILFSEYGINYNNELEMFKKGSILLYDTQSSETFHEAHEAESKSKSKRYVKMEERERKRSGVKTMHIDLIGNAFWAKYKHILTL